VFRTLVNISLFLFKEETKTYKDIDYLAHYLFIPMTSFVACYLFSFMLIFPTHAIYVALYTLLTLLLCLVGIFLIILLYYVLRDYTKYFCNRSNTDEDGG